MVAAGSGLQSSGLMHGVEHCWRVIRSDHQSLVVQSDCVTQLTSHGSMLWEVAVSHQLFMVATGAVGARKLSWFQTTVPVELSHCFKQLVVAECC
jgi:hypothetical protein